MGSLILLSGGQDSATCLAEACSEYDSVHTISFDYGQRHHRELECSKTLSNLAGVTSHTELKVSSLQLLGGSALIGDEGAINQSHPMNESVPASFVPGRNYIFLGLAAAKAYQLGIDHLITGVCQTDFSGYADCRDNSIKAIQVALSNCLSKDIYIHTPLMWKTKAETVLLMKNLGKLDWYQHTHTCYEGMYPPCRKCPACLLRAKGFREAGIEDPIFTKQPYTEELYQNGLG